MIAARDLRGDWVARRAFEQNKVPRLFHIARREPVERGLRLHASHLREIVRHIAVQIARVDQSVKRNHFRARFVRGVHVRGGGVSIHRLNHQEGRAIGERGLDLGALGRRIVVRRFDADGAGNIFCVFGEELLKQFLTRRINGG